MDPTLGEGIATMVIQEIVKDVPPQVRLILKGNECWTIRTWDKNMQEEGKQNEYLSLKEGLCDILCGILFISIM